MEEQKNEKEFGIQPVEKINEEKQPSQKRTSGIELRKRLSQEEIRRYKKWMFYCLMGVIFIVVMYLIFAPSKKEKADAQAGEGINMNIPQVIGDNVPQDKETAYEQAIREQNEMERASAMGALSDFFTDSQEAENAGEKWETISEPVPERGVPPSIGQSEYAYRDIKQTLGNFYEDNSQYEAMQQRIDDLQAQLDKREAESEPDEVEQQLKLMEKSYEMAAKYMPQTGKDNISPFSNAIERPMEEVPDKAYDKVPPVLETTFKVLHDKRDVVSSLWQDISDSLFIVEQMQERNNGFINATQTAEDIFGKNTLKVAVNETVTLKDGETARLRLLESAQVAGLTIPKNTLLTAIAKMQGNRLSLSVISIGYRERIIAVNLTAYDADGQAGIFVPHSLELNAAKEIVAGVGQSAGTSFTFSSSAGQQILADAGKGLMQGTSQYIGNKMREVKVTLKSGHRLFLMQNK